ncbi:hypothetical protein FRC04_010107 [Tulasnella sp. 424]|nr:hypothetical protein FRC04_010107 [Tulasnella sp. 424]KAG8974129.1 hypothetical protein FRC05_007877 [Tulasnella sp. 425]
MASTASAPPTDSSSNSENMPLVGTPFKNENGAFEYPFPTPPLPSPPYQPSSATPSPTGSVVSAVMASAQGRPDSPANKMSAKLVKEGPIPPGLLNANGQFNMKIRRGS